MAIRLRYIVRIFFLVLLVAIFQTACTFFRNTSWSYNENPNRQLKDVLAAKHPKDSISIRVGTFLGNEKRNYYGDSAPARLDIVWKTFLGGGKTIVTPSKGVEEWFGAGWTGQPLVVNEKNETFLLQGAFDHHLKKINAKSGELIWEYTYDDILKGTGTIWVNDSATDPLNRILVLQGSRKGVCNSLCAPVAASFRAVSYFTGKEIWRMNVEHTDCYSRDVDASALVLRDTAYIGLENGKFISFDPGRKVISGDTVNAPRIFTESILYDKADAAKHGGNLVTEGSPARIGNHFYLASGSGHVYGYNIDTKALDWDFYIGSDMDGTPVVSSDSCLLIAVEKQYIAGCGGIFKLNPRKPVSDCVEWYFPTGDFQFSSWEGGVIGSVSVNDTYNPDGMYPKMAAFTGIDGYLNVVQYDRIRKDTTVTGPDGKTQYPCPKTLFRKRIGPSISTPIFVKDKLVAAGYGGITIFGYDRAAFFHELSFHGGIFEATPVADQGKIFIAARDGYLYCFGDTTGNKQQTEFLAVIPKSEPLAMKKTEAKKPSVKAEVKKSEAVPGPFYLIAGAFRLKSNAESVAAQWKRKGVHATVMNSPNNLYYVSLGSAVSREKAEEIHTSLLGKYAVDAWVYEEKCQYCLPQN